MNRLTEAIEHCYDVANSTCGECGEEHLQLAKWLEELKAYKSTGLEPEEMKKGYEAMKNAYDVCIEREELHAEIQEQIREYRNLEEQGLLIKLPCKPYTKVYQIYTEFIDGKSVKGVEEQLLIRFGKSQYYDYAVLKQDNYEYSVTFEQFGKTVFLTREEAEKALEGKENEN